MDRTHCVEFVGVLDVQSAAVGRFAVPDNPVHLRPSRCAMSVARVPGKGLPRENCAADKEILSFFLKSGRRPTSSVPRSRSGVWKEADAVAMPFLAVAGASFTPSSPFKRYRRMSNPQGTCIHSFTPKEAGARHAHACRSSPPLALPPSLTPTTTARETTTISFAMFHSAFSILVAS
uniref:Uncharacterized protein n=1 Tax=Oryza rufipogon TaxID=4529 RepID=A0A0E0RGR2_ORYRU